MAKTDKATSDAPVPPAPEFSEADKSKARAWFKRAAALREQRNYDYAIENILQGLEIWPEAVDEGHLPLWSLAIQRQQAGGKKPGMMEAMKHSVSDKDARKATLNAEWLLARDPTNAGYVDALLKNAVRADLPQTTKWIAPKVMESLRKDKKPNTSRFKTFRQNLIEMAERCDARGDHETTAWCYERAVEAVEYLLAHSPGDMALKDEQRDLSGRLTITKGKYSSAGDFRDSLRDADAQKRLHDQERIKQGEHTLDDLIRSTRADYEANPGVSSKFNAYIDALLKTERSKEELLAIELLLKAYEESKNYSFKLRADDVRLRQLARQTRQLRAKANQSGSDDDRQQARLAAAEETAVEIEVYRERVYNYPTDLRLKYKLGEACFRAGEFDEAIPMLQMAQADPRYRARAQLLMGRSFYAKGLYQQAADVLKDAIDTFQPTGDDSLKHLLWWVGKAQQAAGHIEEARAALNKLVIQDYNFADGEARKLLEELKNA